MENLFSEVGCLPERYVSHCNTMDCDERSVCLLSPQLCRLAPTQPLSVICNAIRMCFQIETEIAHLR